jgi:hypothetical protein
MNDSGFPQHPRPQTLNGGNMLHHPNHRRQAQWYVLVAVLAAALAVLTTAEPDWIEHLFGITLDGGSGALEWAIPVALTVVALLGAVGGVRHLRLSRA